MCLLPATALPAPFASQDQNPFSLINGQPQPVQALLPAAGNWQWSLGLDITNTLNNEMSDQEFLFMDFESYMLRLNLGYALNADWAVMLDLPFVARGGGMLDDAIDGWHDLFGFPEAARPLVDNDQFRISYVNNGINEYLNTRSTQGPGDIQLGVGYQLHAATDAASSVWLIADLPSGERDELTGNDAVDLAVVLSADYRLHPEWWSDANLGVLIPGDHRFGGLQSEDSVLFGHIGLAWQVHPMLDLKLQFGGHTRHYENSSLKLLGSAYNIIFGGTVHFQDCSSLQLAVSEDIMVGATPDVSFLVHWRSHFDRCERKPS